MIRDEMKKYERITGNDANDVSVAYLGGFLDGYEKAEKYRWHDLIQNPNDLPEEVKTVIVYMCHRDNVSDDYVMAYRDFDEYGCVCWCVSENDETFEYAYDMKYWDVIAWKEIEPFEEESCTN